MTQAAPKDWDALRARYQAIGGEIWRSHPDDSPSIYAVSWNACDWTMYTLAQAKKLVILLEADHRDNQAREAAFWERENRNRPKADRVPLDHAGLPLKTEKGR